jgi:hypothetical protein
MQASHGDAGGSMLFRRGHWVLSSYPARNICNYFWCATQKILDTEMMPVIMVIRTEMNAEGKYRPMGPK